MHISHAAQMRMTITKVGMNTPELKIEQLQWQLDLLGNLQPATLGSTIESYGFHLSVEQENWAAEILEFFACRCFEGFESFLLTIEERYDKANKPIGVVEAPIFREWWELRKMEEDDIFFSSTRNGVNASFHPKDGSVQIDGFERKEWRDLEPIFGWLEQSE